MASYYFSNTGNDGDPGSQAQPWQTLAKFRTEETAGTFGSGDTIYFEAGGTWVADRYMALEIKTCSGASGNPITITRYGHGPDPIIDGEDDLNFSKRILMLAGVSWWKIEHLEIKRVYESDAVKLSYNVHDVKLRYIYVHDVGEVHWSGGFSISGTDTDNGPYNISLEYCRAEDVYGESYYIGDASDAEDSHDITLKGCISINSESEAVDLKSSCRNVTITGCYFVNSCWGGYGGRADLSLNGQDHIVEDCRIISNSVGTYPDQAIYIGHNDDVTSPARVTVRRNYIYSSQAYSIRCQGDDNTIEHNVFDGGTTTIFYQHDSLNSHNHTIRYNRFRNWGSYAVQWASASAAGYTFDYNHYCDGDADVWYYDGAARSLAYVQGTIGKETNGDATCAAGTYYVDGDAVADGVGSLASPWNTLDHLNELDGDDTLYLRGDSPGYQDYNEETFVAQGRTAATLTISPYDTELVELRSPSGSRIMTILGNAVTVAGKHQLRFEGQDYSDRILNVDGDGVTVQDAELKSTTTQAVYASDRCDGVTLEALTIHDAGAGVVLDGVTADGIVQNCVLHSLLSSASAPNTAYPTAFAVLNAAADVDLFNNTVEDSPANSLYFSAAGLTDVVIKNCIFRNCGNIENQGAAGLTYDYNCWSACTETLVGAHDVNADPQFVDEAGHDYQIRVSSPCLDAGDTIASVTDDLLGVARPQGSAYDIGAYEGELGSPSASPTPSPSSSESPSPSESEGSASPSASASVSPSPSPSLSPSASVSPSPSPTPSPSASISPSPPPIGVIFYFASEGLTTVDCTSGQYTLETVPTEYLPLMATPTGDGSIPPYVVESIPIVVRPASEDALAILLQNLHALQLRAAQYWVDQQQVYPVWLYARLDNETNWRRVLVKRLDLAFQPIIRSFYEDCGATSVAPYYRIMLLVERHPYWEAPSARSFPIGETMPNAVGVVETYDYTALQNLRGDVPARIEEFRVSTRVDESLARFWMGLRSAARHGTLGNFEMTWELEDGTLVADNSIYLDSAGIPTETNSASPGNGAGDAVIVNDGAGGAAIDWDDGDFHQVCEVRLNQITANESDNYGVFLWLLRARASSDDVWQVQLRYGYRAMADDTYKRGAITEVTSSSYNLFEPDVMSIPLRDIQTVTTGLLADSYDQEYTIQVWARRTTDSAGLLYLDALFPMPIDEGFCKLALGTAWQLSGAVNTHALYTSPLEHHYALVRDPTGGTIEAISQMSPNSFRLPVGDGRMYIAWARSASSDFTDFPVGFGPGIYYECWLSLRGAE